MMPSCLAKIVSLPRTVIDRPYARPFALLCPWHLVGFALLNLRHTPGRVCSRPCSFSLDESHTRRDLFVQLGWPCLAVEYGVVHYINVSTLPLFVISMLGVSDGCVSERKPNSIGYFFLWYLFIIFMLAVSDGCVGERKPNRGC